MEKKDTELTDIQLRDAVLDQLDKDPKVTSTEIGVGVFSRRDYTYQLRSYGRGKKGSGKGRKNGSGRFGCRQRYSGQAVYDSDRLGNRARGQADARKPSQCTRGQNLRLSNGKCAHPRM